LDKALHAQAHKLLAASIPPADSSRELLGIAFKTLGLGYNPSAAELAAAGITQVRG